MLPVADIVLVANVTPDTSTLPPVMFPDALTVVAATAPTKKPA